MGWCTTWPAPTGARRTTCRRCFVDGTARLLEAVEPDARLVLLSSTSVYGWDQAWPADHTTPPQPSSAYGRAKLAAEDLVRARSTGTPSTGTPSTGTPSTGTPSTGTPSIGTPSPGGTVIARSTIVYGSGDRDGMLARVARLLARHVRWLPGDGANRVHLIHVDDLVAALLLPG